MSYAVYLRKSRMDPEVETVEQTLERHKRTLIELAKQRGYAITGWYEEVVSGDSIAARPKMQELLADVEKGLYDGVLCMEIERLSRGSPIDQGIVSQTFKFSGTKIITPQKVYDLSAESDEEMLEFGLFFSRHEYRTIKRRLVEGRKSAALEGKYPYSSSPLGYRRVKIEGGKGYTLEIVPEEAEIIKLCYDLYIDGLPDENGVYHRMGYEKISKYLQRFDVKPRKSEWFTYQIVADILGNVLYAGKIAINKHPSYKVVDSNGNVVLKRKKTHQEQWTIVDGIHPAIISYERWLQFVDIRDHKERFCVPENRTLSNPLCGILRCSVCGRSMTRQPSSTNRTQIMCRTPGCTTMGSAIELVEKRVLQQLREWLGKYQFALRGGDRPKTDAKASKEKALRDNLAEQAKIKKQITATYDLLEQGIYSIDTFSERSKLLSEQEKRLIETQSALEQEIKKIDEIEKQSQYIVPKVENILEHYDEIEDVAAQNELLRSVIDHIDYTKPKAPRSQEYVDHFTLDIFMRMPIFSDNDL